MKNRLNKIIEKNRYIISRGKQADYIPALSRSNPNDIGICIMDLEGSTYKAGEYNEKFTIQSISKVISLMLAIMDNGEKAVFEKVGYKSSEDGFNSLFKLDLPNMDKPSNPMINSGAIVTTSLIKGKGEEKFNRLLNLIRRITENPNIEYSEEVYLSEKSTGDKNKAIAYLMKSKGFLDGNIEEVLDNYFKQCSIEIDTVDLAKIALFLAKGGVLPGREKRICEPEIISTVIAIMGTSGLYDFSGEYAAKVGIPSKSGVAGGLLGTLPNKLGIGIYNPVLDKTGNPIVGYNIMKDISKEFNLSIF